MAMCGLWFIDNMFCYKLVGFNINNEYAYGIWEWCVFVRVQQ